MNYKIRILLFDDVELLDFAGPMEVWSVANYLSGDELNIDVKSIADQGNITVSKSELLVQPHIIGKDKDIDLLIIPGGFGTRPILKSEEKLKYVESLTKESEVIGSVCTGASVLGKLGLLKNLKVTTHQLGIDLVKETDPTVMVDTSHRFIDHNCIITSAGVSAGIDMSLYLVSKYFGDDLKMEVATYMEYPLDRN